MKQELTIGAAQKLTSPNPFALLTVRKPDGNDNVMAVSWWTYTSNHPASLAICLSKKGYSGQCIQAEGRFAVNIVAEALHEAAFYCGTCSGRDHTATRHLSQKQPTVQGYLPDKRSFPACIDEDHRIRRKGGHYSLC